MLGVQLLHMETLNKKILVALLDMAQTDVAANVQVLAQELGYSRREVAEVLNELAEEGLVRAETVRLTFVGLMQATGLRSRLRRQKPRASEAA